MAYPTISCCMRLSAHSRDPRQAAFREFRVALANEAMPVRADVDSIEERFFLLRRWHTRSVAMIGAVSGARRGKRTAAILALLKSQTLARDLQKVNPAAGAGMPSGDLQRRRRAAWSDHF